MILKNMVEMLQESFPDMTLIEAKLRLNNAQKFFTRKTKLNIMDFEVDVTDFVNGRALLDSSIESVRSAGFVDADGVLVSSAGWKYKIQDRYVYVYDTGGMPLTTFPEGVASLRLRVVYIPLLLTNLDQEPIFPEEFHDALVWKVMEDKAILSSKMDLAKMAGDKFKEKIIEGIRYANKEADGTVTTWHSRRDGAVTSLSLEDDRDI